MLKHTLILIYLISGFAFAQPWESISFSEMKAHSRIFKSGEINYPGDSTIDVKYYKLNLFVNYDTKLIKGEVLVLFQVASAIGLNSIHLDLKSNMVVDSVKSGSKLLTYSHNLDIVTIDLGSNYALNSLAEVVIYYHGSPAENNFGGFVFERTPSGNPIVWTLSQPYESKNWWPCKDALNDKADSADIWITSSPAFTSVSNGNLIEVKDNPDGTRTYKWKVTYPIVNYLISIAMADYMLQTDYFHYSAADSMPVTHYVWREKYNDLIKEQLNRTIPALDVFSELFGPYPWLDEKYGHAQCSFSGGMEHQTIASMGHFDESLILHELAHQWFGDKITCETWRDIWLNEGFATYSVALFNEQEYGKAYYNSTISENMQVASTALGSIYVQDITRLSEIFDHRRSYSKGAVVLHMLRGVVGDSLFFKILKTYAQHPEFSYSTVTTADFQAVAESVSGIDLDYFFSEWIFGQNFPKYTVSWGYQHLQDSTYKMNIKIDQQTNISPKYFTMPVQVKVQTNKGDTLVILFNNQKSQSFSFNVTGQPEFLDFDPNNLILKTYKVLTDSGSDPILKTFSLSQNYPNPFNPSTKIDFTIPGDGINREFIVLLKIYDVLGNEMAVLINETVSPGEHSLIFEPEKYGLSSGVYFYNITIKSPEKNLIFNDTGKMIYLR